MKTIIKPKNRFSRGANVEEEMVYEQGLIMTTEWQVLLGIGQKNGFKRAKNGMR